MANFELAARYAGESDAAYDHGLVMMERGELGAAYQYFLAADIYAAHELAALRGEW